MSNKRWFMPFLLLLVLVLAACGGAAAEPTPAPTATTATTAQGGDDGGTEATDEPEATEEPADEVEPTEEAVEPTEEAEPTEEVEPTAEATEEAGTDEPTSTGDSTTIEDAENITSYRFSATITASGEAFEADEDMAMFGDGITIEGAFTKEPPASDVALEIPGLGEIGFREVDGSAYANFGGMWTESSSEEALNIDDLSPITADDIGDDLDRMEDLGAEEVNGRDTDHYQADKELLQEIAEEQGDSGDFDFANADEATLDVWLDQEYGFVVKMELVAEGAGLNDQLPDAAGRIEFLIEYFDFNADDIVIEVPELTDTGDTGDTGDDSGDTGDTGDDSGDTSMDAVDLPGLLGFDIELPADAEAEVSFGTATITIPLPMDEAQAIIQEAFEANGYELDPDLSSPELGILWYANGDKEWYITLTETDGVTEVFIF